MRVTTVIETEDFDKIEVCINDNNQIILDFNKLNYKLEVSEAEELCNVLSGLCGKIKSDRLKFTDVQYTIRNL